MLREVGEILRACATGQSDRTCCDCHLVQRLLHNAGHEWLVARSDFPYAATENPSTNLIAGAEQFWPLSILSGERDPGKLAKGERRIRVSQEMVMNSFHFDLDRMLLDKAKVRIRREMRAGTFVNVKSLFRKAASWSGLYKNVTTGLATPNRPAASIS